MPLLDSMHSMVLQLQPYLVKHSNHIMLANLDRHYYVTGTFKPYVAAPEQCCIGPRREGFPQKTV